MESWIINFQQNWEWFFGTEKKSLNFLYSYCIILYLKVLKTRIREVSKCQYSVEKVSSSENLFLLKVHFHEFITVNVITEFDCTVVKPELTTTSEQRLHAYNVHHFVVTIFAFYNKILPVNNGHKFGVTRVVLVLQRFDCISELIRWTKTMCPAKKQSKF